MFHYRFVIFIIALLSFSVGLNCNAIVIADAIVDNVDPETSQTGSWSVSGGLDPFDPNDPAADSLWARGGDDTFTWHFTPLETGTYEVWEWHTGWSSRTDAAPHRITYAEGDTTILVDQKANVGQWNSLGIFPFEAGQNYLVTVTSAVGTASTCADAMRWTLVSSGNLPPTASIDLIAPNPAGEGDTITFTGSGNDIDGSIVAYEWRSSIDGSLSSNESFSTATLSVGTHTITFEVWDDDGNTSAPVTQVLTVTAPAQEIIRDNKDPDTSGTGSWSVSRGTGPFDPADPSADSLWARDGDDTFSWHFTAPQTGTYEVWEWHTGWSSRTNAAPHLITYTGGEMTISVDQTIEAGQWNSMGTYFFVAGESHSVTVTSVAGSASTCADAMRWTFVSNGNEPPTALIESITPNSATEGETVTFTGSGSDTDGTIAAYRWGSSLDGNLSTGASFSSTTLSVGSHVITFEVQDDDGDWSDAVTQGVTIQAIGANVPPTALIESITPNSATEGETVTFTGSGSDTDGTIAAYRWGSSLDGNLSTGASFSNTTLSVGSHVITFEVQDDDGDWSDAVTQGVTIQAIGANVPPTALIESITPNSATEGETVIFTGSGSDTDGTIAAYRWGSSLDGNLSADASFSSTALSVGSHVITFEVQDDDGDWSDAVTQGVTIQAIGANVPPTALIESITPNSANEGETVTFTGSGSDTDGTIAAYRWGSSLDGNLSTGASFSSTTLSVGSHVITFEVQDDDGDWSDLLQRVLVITQPYQETIRDNGDPDTSQTGTWDVSRGLNPFDSNDPDANSVWARGGDDTYSWHFTAPQTGTYEVWEWHTGWPSRTNAAPHLISHDGGDTTIVVNQKVNAGQWNSMGSYMFIAGENYRVTVTSVVGTDSTCADAIRWTSHQIADNPPMAFIESITPNPVNDGEPVSFTGSGDAMGGTIVGYQWRSSVDGILSSTDSFITSSLSVGTHTILFEVQNDKGFWSAADILELDVNMIYSEVFPGERWKTATPESQGVDSTVLQQAIDYFAANSGGVGVDEMLVVRNGYLIWKGTSIENQHETFSASKTFTTTTLDLLLQDGLITEVDALAVDYFPALDDTYAQYNGITFRQFATMTSGYDGINGDCWQLFLQGAYDEHDACVRTYTTPGPPLSDAGTVFNYHDPAVHMLGHIMVQIAGRSLEDIFKERVADEIGMKTFTWTDYGMIDGLDGIIFNNPAGTPGINQGGVITTAEDTARYGLLYLNRGNWNGRQLLRKEWVDQATTNQVPNSLDAINDHRGRFGYMWHTNDVPLDGERRWPSAPPKSYTFFGFSRNYCFVIPEWNMVIVRMSPYETGGMDNPSSVWDAFFNLLEDGIL